MRDRTQESNLRSIEEWLDDTGVVDGGVDVHDVRAMIAATRERNLFRKTLERMTEGGMSEAGFVRVARAALSEVEK